jgi:hypothetical protein
MTDGRENRGGNRMALKNGYMGSLVAMEFD